MWGILVQSVCKWARENRKNKKLFVRCITTSYKSINKAFPSRMKKFENRPSTKISESRVSMAKTKQQMRECVCERARARVCNDRMCEHVDFCCRAIPNTYMCSKACVCVWVHNVHKSPIYTYIYSIAFYRYILLLIMLSIALFLLSFFYTYCLLYVQQKQSSNKYNIK